MLRHSGLFVLVMVALASTIAALDASAGCINRSL